MPAGVSFVSDPQTLQQLAEHDKRLAVVETKVGSMDHKIDRAIETISENQKTAVAIGKQVAAIEGKIDGSAKAVGVGIGLAALAIPFLVLLVDKLFG